MKRAWVIVLLLSLGLNLGLGLKLLRSAPTTVPVSERDLTGDGHSPPRTMARGEVEGFLQRRLERMNARLDLTAEQRAALWALHQDDGGQVLLRRQELQAARSALRESVATGEPSLAEIQGMQRRISGKQAALDSVVVGIMYHERSILTPEQRQRYRGLFSARQDGRGKREHPGGPQRRHRGGQ